MNRSYAHEATRAQRPAATADYRHRRGAAGGETLTAATTYCRLLPDARTLPCRRSRGRRRTAQHSALTGLKHEQTGCACHDGVRGCAAVSRTMLALGILGRRYF